MLHREQKRISNGHYKKSFAEEIFILAIIITFAGFAGAVIWGSNGLKYYIDHWRQLTLLTFLFPLSIYLFLKISLVLRWCLYWILVTTAILFFLDTTERLSNDRGSIGMWVFIGFICVESATLLVYFWTRLVYPKFVARISESDPLKFWNIEPHPTKKGYFFRKPMFLAKKKFSYIGAVNEKNEPHGFGKWTSDWKTGEVLSGLWENGYPIGPFRSREYQTGYSFANQRIAFVSTDRSSFSRTSTKYRGKFWYGVVSVECSVSGKFFSDLPQTKYIVKPFDESEAQERNQDPIRVLLDKLVHYEELNHRFHEPRNEILVRATPSGFEVPGYTPEANQSPYQLQIRHKSSSIHSSDDISMTRVKSLEPMFDIAGWKMDRPAREALVFITGFNCSVKIACELFGQMITLGGLGSSIKPFVYKWPGGTLVDYYKAKAISKSQQTKDDLIRFFQDLGKAGFHKIHILSHSMGARLVVNSATEFERVFQPIQAQFNSSTTLHQHRDRMKLASVTFLNPETPLTSFKEFHFPLLKSYTDLITIYGSTNDIALLAAEYVFSGKPMLGSRVHDLVHSDHIAQDPEDALDEEDDYLDLDIVDTTELDINIHAVRHVYFSVNKFVIDDIIDLVFTGHRARDRTHRLLNLGRNVYGFLAAPSYVVK
jgi:esterase/lipase superfamily enzyme